MRRRTTVLGAIFLALTPFPTQSASDSARAVEEFHHICLAEGASFMRLSQDAYARAWELLAEVAFDELAPIANPDRVRVWLTTEADGGLPAGTIIGYTTAKLSGKPVQTCTLALPEVDPDEFQKAFFTRTDAEKISEERNPAEINRLYILFVSGRQQFVRLVLPTAKASVETVVIASSIMAANSAELP